MANVAIERSLARGQSSKNGIVVLTFPMNRTADVISSSVFIADQKYRVVSIKEVHAVAEVTASSMILTVRKCTGTQAPSAGVAVSSGISLKSAINTVNDITLGTVSDTESDYEMAAGDRLAIDISDPGTESARVCVTVVLLPLEIVEHYWSPTG